MPFVDNDPIRAEYDNTLEETQSTEEEINKEIVNHMYNEIELFGVLYNSFTMLTILVAFK